jgi:hypothetical protein
MFRPIFVGLLIAYFGCQIKASDEGINAEVVTFVAGSLEAGGLPGCPEVF